MVEWFSTMGGWFWGLGVGGLNVTYILQYSSEECGVRDSLFGNTFYAAQNNWPCLLMIKIRKNFLGFLCNFSNIFSFKY